MSPKYEWRLPAFGWKRQRGDVVWDFEFARHMPPGLIEH